MPRVCNTNSHGMWVSPGRVGGLTQLSGQPEVDELDSGAGLVDTHDVLGLEVQVHDALLVDELHPLRYLPHVLDALPLRQLEVLVDDALEQLAARHAARAQGTLRAQDHGAQAGRRAGQGLAGEGAGGLGRKARGRRGRALLWLPEFRAPALLCRSQVLLCEEGLWFPAGGDPACDHEAVG